MSNGPELCLGVFYSSILAQSLAALRGTFFTDNFEAARYGHDDVDRSRSFDTQSLIFYFD